MSSSSSLPTSTEIAVDAILGALEDQPASVREGTDPMVLLYWWKQRNPDPRLFMRALEDLDRDGLIVIGPPPERRLRLSGHGFAWLDQRLPVDEDPDAETDAADTGAGAGAGTGADPRPAASDTDAVEAPALPRLAAAAPMAERIDALARIFATLGLPPGRGLEAGTLLRIWLLDGHPGAELRDTIDAMVGLRRLTIERGAHTTFALADPEG